MKYRNDFVTNSSSSSFIVAYKDANELVAAIMDFVKTHMKDRKAEGYDVDYEYEYEEREFAYVIADIFANRLSYEDALLKVKSFLEDSCWYKLAQSWDRNRFKNQVEWAHSDEYKSACKKYVEGELEKFKQNYDENSIISYLYYSDSSYMYEIKNNLEHMLKGVILNMTGD